ncbi:10632_t:CDS:2 [Paraglomus occultum]|uniref:10632_t:CDS:1 n=1 Tax=Paraglomus occultum TaxID=144539 RepID=A0A9N9D9S1_9GLOM|nr:10632_t:CDS:2 [Paraglomus occultum]
MLLVRYGRSGGVENVSVLLDEDTIMVSSAKLIVNLILPEEMCKSIFPLKSENEAMAYAEPISTLLVTIEACNWLMNQVAYAYDFDELFRKSLSASTFFLGLFY